MSRKIRYIRLVDNADEVIDFLLLVILCGGIEGAKAPNGKMSITMISISCHRLQLLIY